MARNQLPEGVGKKIVEALKRQAEADITPIAQADAPAPAAAPIKTAADTAADTAGFNEADFDDFKDTAAAAGSLQAEKTEPAASAFDIKFKDDSWSSEKASFQTQPASFDFQNKKEDAFPSKDSYSNSMFTMNKKDDIFAQPAQETYAAASAYAAQNKRESSSDVLFKSGNDASSAISFASQSASSGMLSYSGIPFNEEQKITPAPANVSISIPTNVAVLKNLIASLPVGVTKQTGAQIIRQTLEAMGLPMASVLKEAQEVQEELNTNTRECMLKIQEYKTNIMQLEQSVQEYQKNMTQINDLVSLFLLTDRKVQA